MGASKTYNNAKRFYYWPGIFDWICAFTADCLTCQNTKPKPKHRNEVPLEEWQNETVPFRTIHSDHKGPLHPSSNRNLHCLLFIEAFCRFLMVYPVTNTGAQDTLSAIEKWIIPSEFLNLLCITEVRLSSIPNSLTGRKKWESLCNLEQHSPPGLMAKLKPRINTLHAIGENS